MSPAARLDFLVRANEQLTEIERTMSEGMEHKTVKDRSADTLRLHFGKQGRAIYVAADLSVAYPRESPFAPDLFAVLGVPQPAYDTRLAWVVEDEGKGLDFVLEVLHHGDRQKDLVRNVTRYAQLGIHEYFVYDIGKQMIHGYRLSLGGGARRYERIIPQGGLYPSAVLDLNLSIRFGMLRFLAGISELADSAELIVQLSGMVDAMESKYRDVEAKAEEAKAALDASEAKAEEAKAALGSLISGTRSALFALLESRKLTVSSELRARIDACEDTGTLQRWLLRAISAASAEEALSEG